MKFKYELHQLSDMFYQDYPLPDYPELIRNREQSYISIERNTNFLISIPFRSHINHKNIFLFSTSERSGKSKSGLDYSKIVIIQNPDYIDAIAPAIVDEDEFNETQQNIRKIEQDSCTYINASRYLRRAISMSTMLLSIKPKYAKAILDGEKQFEFRKSRCRSDVTRIIFYSSSPQKQVVGEAEIDEIIEDAPSEVWKTAKSAAGISKNFFDSYFAGEKTAVAYHLKNVVVYDKPRSLADYGIKNPPQSYVYIT